MTWGWYWDHQSYEFSGGVWILRVSSLPKNTPTNFWKKSKRSYHCSTRFLFRIPKSRQVATIAFGIFGTSATTPFTETPQHAASKATFWVCQGVSSKAENFLTKTLWVLGGASDWRSFREFPWYFPFLKWRENKNPFESSKSQGSGFCFLVVSKGTGGSS